MKKKKQQRKRGIAEEIQVSILSKVVIVFVIVAAVVTFMVGNISLSAQKNDLEMQSKAAAYQLEIFFEEYTTVAEQMALNTDVQTLLEETGPGANITESERYATVFNTMKKTAAADSDNIQAVWVGDIDANVLTQSDGYTSGSDFEITERAWYKAVEEEKTILTDAYVDASTGNVILSAATPVYDQSGQNIIGVAGVDVALDHIDELLPEYKIGNNGFVILVTSEGNVIYHPNTDNQQKSLSELNVDKTLIQTVEGGKDTSVHYSADGKSKYGYVGRIGSTDYLTISCLPASEYFASLIRCIIIVLLLVIAGIVVIIITIRHLATQLTKPIVALNDVAQELAEGNLDVTLDIASENEIGELADSIQKTVDRLKEYINYIDEISSVLDRLADGKLKFTLKYDYAGEFAKVKTALLHISGSFEQMIEDIIDSSTQVSIGADELSKAANNTRDLIEISLQQIDRGSSLAQNVVQSMQDVLDAVEEVNGMIGKSAENNEAQNQSMEQIRVGIEDISKGVEDNSASAEETSATSQELAAQAATLEELVKRFDLKDHGREE